MSGTPDVCVGHAILAAPNIAAREIAEQLTFPMISRFIVKLEKWLAYQMKRLETRNKCDYMALRFGQTDGALAYLERVGILINLYASTISRLIILTSACQYLKLSSTNIVCS